MLSDGAEKIQETMPCALVWRLENFKTKLFSIKIQLLKRFRLKRLTGNPYDI